MISSGGLSEIPPARIAWAAALTLLNYLILVGYDWLAIRYIGHPMSLPRIILASFLGYAVGNNLGTLLGGSTIRLRLYTAWGLSAVEIVKLVLMLSVTFWIGLFALSGVVFVLDPLTIPARLHLPVASTLPLGIALGCVAAAYLVLCAVQRRPLKIWQWDLSPPPVGLSVLQYVVATLDLMVAAAVLYILLPASLDVSYIHFLAIYLLALVAALFSQVPGGLGVMELVILVLLTPSDPRGVVGALLAYRVIYYLIPLALGLLVLGGNELAFHRRRVRTAATRLGQWTTVVAPRLLAATTFLAGVLLMFSGATPAARGRLRLLREVLPLPVLEMSHLLGSVAGILLILLARSLQRRVESAYYAVLVLLTGGIAFSLLKGFDYEEAIILAVMLAIFAPSRRHFYRKGALLTDRFSASWFAAIGLVIACTLWLMFFAYKHVEYNHELWWEVTFQQSAPRSLRAMAIVVLVTLLFAVSRLLRPKPKTPGLATPGELATARQIVANSRRTSANLALLGDKHLLFNTTGTAFLMYGIEGRSWISMGDPVGDALAQRELIWEFLDRCDEGGRWPVFYEIDHGSIATYVETGLSLIKIGEEARVPLPSFGLEGGSHKSLRRTIKHLTDEACMFEIVDPPLPDELIADLTQISNAWLAEKNSAEKGFSLGFFQAEYIRHCPVAIVTQRDKRIAFANLWCGAGHEELSLDLMRYLPSAPAGVMEFLFIQLMVRGRGQGYQWFNLGMAPLSGVEAQPLGPLWNRIAELAYRHGEHFYNFRGLRQYKDKFDPVWSPKYLAAPGGLALTIILANVATLISGGLAGLVKK